MQGILIVCTQSVLGFHIPTYVDLMSVLIKCWIAMMILCYHGMVPVQYLCDIDVVMVSALCDLTETNLALIKL